MRLYRGEPFMHGAQRQVDDASTIGCWWLSDPRSALQRMTSNAGQLYMLDVTATEVHPERTFDGTLGGKVFLITARVARRAVAVSIDYTLHPPYDAARFGPNPVFSPDTLDSDGHVR